MHPLDLYVFKNLASFYAAIFLFTEGYKITGIRLLVNSGYSLTQAFNLFHQFENETDYLNGNKN